MIPTSRRQPTHRRDENFKPRSEWKEQEGVTILSVYLPGFVQERIKMLIDEPTRTLKLQGQRWMQNNRLIRFNELFTIPEDCDISKISNQFKFGVYRIKMPKLVIAQTNPKEDVLSASPQEIINAKAKKKLEDVNTESTSTSNGARKRIYDQNVKSQIPGIGYDEVISSIPNVKKPRNEENDETSFPRNHDDVVNSNIPNEKEQKNVENLEEENKILNNVEGKETQEKGNESSVDNEKEKEKSGTTDHEKDGVGAKPKDDQIPETIKAMEIVSKKNLKDLNEERKLLVNVGAAILVMVGFGAYTFYSCN